MRLTREGDYAVRVLVDLAGRPPGAMVRTEELTRTTQVSKAYLAKIIQLLSRAGLVQTQQGPRGGVRLRRDPAAITLREMVEAVEGPIFLNRCLIRPGECARDSFCTVHPVWGRIQAVLMRELEAVSAKDLAQGGDMREEKGTA